jgi:hypothetical protein
VSSSFEIPPSRAAVAGSSSNPYTVELPSPTKPPPKPRKPRAKKVSAGPSMPVYDPHPFSYPTMPAPPTTQSRAAEIPAQPPAKRQRKTKADPDVSAVPFKGPSMAVYDPHPFSYPAMPAPPTTQNRAADIPAQPPAKRQRKKKADPDAPVPEKRGAMFKRACPKNILDRVDRVMSQR